MKPSGIDSLLNGSGCIGAFVVDGEALRPLSNASEDARDTAGRTRALWASLVPVVSDAGIVIGKRPKGMSIASQKGGLILEAKGAFNIGMLRAAMQHEDPVLPTAVEAPSTGTKAANIAIWAFATWIDETETPRHLVLHVGAETFSILARKGKFAMVQGEAPSAIAAALLDAERNGTAVELSMGPLPDHHGELDFTALDLFEARSSETDEWLMDRNALPASIPEKATFAMTRDVAALAQKLSTWGEGEACELSVLRHGNIKQVIATTNTAGEVMLKALEHVEQSNEGH